MRLEAGGWRLEVGGWRLEAGSRRLEAVGWRLAAGWLEGNLSKKSAELYVFYR